MKYHFFFRQRDGKKPPGYTVSKNPVLPKGDFVITEYLWPGCSLWFIDQDNFSDDERQDAHQQFFLFLKEATDP